MLTTNIFPLEKAILNQWVAIFSDIYYRGSLFVSSLYSRFVQLVLWILPPLWWKTARPVVYLFPSRKERVLWCVKIAWREKKVTKMPQAVLKANVPLLLSIPFSPSSPSMYYWYMRWFHIDCSSFLVQRTQKSISETELAELRQRSQTTTTYLQIPPRQTAPQLTRQRSQPIQPRPSGTTLSPASGNASSTTPPPPQSMNIPTLAVTPVSSAPNIVIEHYPTIIRLVSIEEMNTGTDPLPSTIPTLTRASSCIGKIEIILMVKPRR